MKNSFIFENIRKALIRQLVFPLILLFTALFLSAKVPRDNFLQPRPLNSRSHYENFYNRNLPHIVTDTPKLHYTGFNYTVNGQICGYYYYTLNDGYCQFYLLNQPNAHAAGELSHKSLRGRLVKLKDEEYNNLTAGMAKALNWNPSSLRRLSAPYAVSDLPYPFYSNLILLLLLYGCILLAFVDLMFSLAYIIWPDRSPTFRYLRAFGEVRTLLPKVEMEIKHLTITKAGSIYLTPSYIVNMDTVRTIILPLQSVLWIYYHSHLRRFLGLRVKLHYTLHIVAKDGKTYDFTKKTQSELDFIMDILKERRPEILFGYSEQNKTDAKKQVKRADKSR